MDSEDDLQPLVVNASDCPLDAFLELTIQNINTDPEFEQVVYGYRRSRWRTALVHAFSVLTAGIPFLLFHWCPTWYLYITSVRCQFQIADKVLVIETYQQKHESFYIHRILDKNIGDTSGLINQGYSHSPDEKTAAIDVSGDLITPIHFDDGSTINTQHYRYFGHKKQILIWDSSRAQWALLAGIESGVTCAQLHEMGAGVVTDERRIRMLNIYGFNEIKVPVQTIMTLIVLEVFNPFYVFQLFTIGVWLSEKYYYYCIAVVLMSTFGVATSVIQTKKNQQNLRATVEAHDVVQLSDGREISSGELAPGDIVLIPSRSFTLLYDAVLLSGSAVVNESMLTGESIPVSKTTLLRVDKTYDFKEHASSTLFSGTRVIQTRSYNNEPVKVLVLRTGYNTAKGQLVRSILYPVPADFKFDRDSYKFIIILSCLAIIGLSYTIGLKAYRSLSPGDIVIKALDIITIVIPPALPAAMTVGRLYAVNRLQRARIACLNTRAVNVSGSLDCICFDKTGTLTEDGLDMWGVVPVSTATFPPHLGTAVRDPRQLNDLHHLKLGMASCHSLSMVDGKLDGDPLDLKMFESTGWSLEVPNVPDLKNYSVLTSTVVRPKKTTNINVDDINIPLELGIVQQYTFVSSLQRSSVVCRMLGEDVLRVYCKGAPEMLRTLCTPESVPEDLNAVLNSYAEKGYRVIALSTRVLEATIKQVQCMTREEVEHDLEFLGLVIMDNRLKAATTGVIRELKEANIHVVMITGDNILTAVSVATECGILVSGERVVHLNVEPNTKTPIIFCDNTLHGASVGRRIPLSRMWCSEDTGQGSWHNSGSFDPEAPDNKPRYKIVMTGDTWRVLREFYPSMVGNVIERGAVFARMSSEQKQQLIVEYQALGYYVGMCGDGANDCGALRSAHTGISLSELESSVAAPFTSANPDIVCVSRVLREGRAALATSFGVFNFMVAYSLTEFISVAILYYFDSNLTDFQFLFIDVALIVNFAFFFGMTEAYTGRLCKIPPLTSLLGLVPLTSLTVHLILIFVIQYLSYHALTFFPWYVKHTFSGNADYECWENYAIFTVSMFQYIILVIVYSHGAPYRRSIVTNKQLMISMVLMTGICIYITVNPAKWLANFLQLKMPLDSLLSYLILSLAFLHFAVAVIFERFVVQYLMERKQMIPKFLKEKRVKKTPHLMIRRHLTNMDYLDSESIVQYE